VAAPNTRKAAALLAHLEPGVAAELIKSAPPELIAEITAEVLVLRASGTTGSAGDPAQEFFGLLAGRRPAAVTGPEGFARQMLEGAVGKGRSDELFSRVQTLVDARDPFMAIRKASVEELAAALTGEHPQVAALVLAELPPARTKALVPLLDETTRIQAVSRMTTGERVPPETRNRVAGMVKRRIEEARRKAAAAAADEPAPVAAPAAAPAGKKTINPRRRQVALLLRSLEQEMRDGMLKSIGEKDPDAAAEVQDLMVLWSDIPAVEDRSLQEALRNCDSRALALALVGVDGAVGAKIRANISQRARQLIEEETQLMKKPKADEIDEARETVLGVLRQMNVAGGLAFVEEE
jgi:flagellar motor switch protein FliG